MNRSIALSILGRLKPDLGKRYKVYKLGIFGSMARNEARPDSDVDVLVDMDPSIGLQFVDMAMEIEQAFGLLMLFHGELSIPPDGRRSNLMLLMPKSATARRG